jgi:hypothetical protein
MVGFISNLAALAACDAIVDRVDLNSPPGHLKVYSGSVPTDADTALGAQVLLADLTMGNPAFGPAADINPGARATAAAISDDTSANNTGVASFFRIDQGGGTTVMQGACATSGSELNFNSTSISSGAIVSVTSFTVTVPES